MNIKLQQLRHFLFVVEEGGFRAAANRANRSQATLSASVKTLEEALGQRLFEQGNNAVLTPFGQFCVFKIKQFISIYEAFEADLIAAAKGQVGEVRIASVPSLVTKLIPNVLAEYSKRYPNIEINLIDDSSVGVSNRLLAGEVDIALGNLTTAQQYGIEFRHLLTDPVGVVCTREHRLAGYVKGVVWQDLLGEPFIYNGTCNLLNVTPAYRLNQQPRYKVENITSLFSLLTHGLGITTLPKLAFPSDNESLVWLPLLDPVVARQIGIFSIPGRSISPQAQIFSDLCVEYVQTLAK
ncbi:LysR family transcriptional regulator [Neisseria montereyensis]|uniref:LysR family transcriptional regulator n=1 Tax=Neisseria montereyensis TaxID=2973938 RepID=A0ABT2FAX4_9NEIS|nr:LysR family transcriptional regulator [Neisseria montereyensis]MCS4533245.1 LysR family transcriptional regulator [Neisseria montereyensis]